MSAPQTLQKLAELSHTPVNRRALLKRVGLLGVALPLGGTLAAACADTGRPEPVPTYTPRSGSARQVVAQAAAAQAPAELTITAKDLSFTPTTFSAAANQPVRFTFINSGVMEHDVAIPDMPITALKVDSEPSSVSQRMADLLSQSAAKPYVYAGAGAGQQMVIEFTPTTAGTYAMACTIPGHADAGMKATFTVTGQGASAQASASPVASATPMDDHMMPSTAPATGTPYAADRLPQPVVAAPIGAREPQLVTQELTIEEKIGYLDDGVAYQFWTFGGTIPGPMIRARVGDSIELTLKNPAESTMTHNIDLHAVTGPGGGAKMTTIAPGQSATFRWKALHQGVFVYHCATAPIPQHISSGMYGLVVIEPEGGLPPVDREFYIMQGDFYLLGNRGEKGLRGFSMDKLYDEKPDYIVFNGAVGSFTEDRVLHAQVGDTVRIFFGVGGPNIVSSFHVIGAIFERVAQQGAAEWSTHVQTTLVPAGGAMMAELKFEEPGDYTFVDHSLGRLAKGAVGMIHVDGQANPDIITQVQAPG